LGWVWSYELYYFKKTGNYDRRTNHFTWLRTWDDQETKDLQGGRVWAKMLCSLTFVSFFQTCDVALPPLDWSKKMFLWCGCFPDICWCLYKCSSKHPWTDPLPDVAISVVNQALWWSPPHCPTVHRHHLRPLRLKKLQPAQPVNPFPFYDLSIIYSSFF